MAESEILSQLLKKLNNVNDELVKLELNSIIAVEDDRRQHILAKLEAWKLTKEAIINDLTPAFLSHFSLCYDTLDILHRLINFNFDSRVETLTTKVQNENPDEETEQVPDDDDDFNVIKKKVLEKMVLTCRALLGEIKQELDNTDDDKRKKMKKKKKKKKKKMTLSEWLKENDGTPYLPFEWKNLYELRIKSVLTGIKLSKLLVQFMFSLNEDESRLCFLQSKIILSPKKQGSVSGNFVSVMKATRHVMSKAKHVIGKSMKGHQEEGEVNNMMVQFSEAIVNLEFVLCCDNVPDTRSMVGDARMRLDDALGQTLCIMQSLKLRIREFSHKNAAAAAGSWKTLMEFIGKVWSLDRYYG